MRRRRRERAELEAGMMAGPVDPRRITPMDIQQKEFRTAFRGYNEREVITPQDASAIVREHLLGGTIVEDLWFRGW
jgi:hypothetical protein